MKQMEIAPLKFNWTSFSCLVTILRVFTLDLRDSHFKELQGFKREINRESSFETKAPNKTNGIHTLCIYYDLISNSIVDGIYSDTIYTVSTAALTKRTVFKRTDKDCILRNKQDD